MNLKEAKKRNIFNPKDFSYLLKIFGSSKKSWFQSVFLYITEKCQLRCKHCYLGWRLERKATMPLELIIAHLKMWKKIGTKRVCFIGGEPTLHPEFGKAVRYAHKLKYKEIIMDTNGIPPSLEVLNKFNPLDFTYIQVSLDGASPETHDQIRGKGTFEMSFNTIKELSERGFDVRIICTVNKLNIKDCLDILRIADEIGVSLVKYHICSKEGRCKGNSKMIFNPHEWIKFAENFSKFAKRYKTKILFQPSYATRKTGFQYFKEGYTGCIGRTLNKISIFPNGKMYLCSYLFDTDLNFAELINGQIKLNKRFNEINLFLNQEPKCNNCQFNRICRGGCPAEKILMGSLPCEKYSDIFSICRLWKSSV
ncbi:radical SAM protein [Patescibacteria group bacterium]|nr:radical SAM protein [Patescibacteria group bacterium]